MNLTDQILDELRNINDILDAVLVEIDGCKDDFIAVFADAAQQIVDD